MALPVAATDCRHRPRQARRAERILRDGVLTPGHEWAADHGLTFPLSALVVYDSYIHSGSILPLIRRTFPEPTPDAGGDERAWTTAYVKARHTWLAGHPRAIIRKTQYRTRCLDRDPARELESECDADSGERGGGGLIFATSRRPGDCLFVGNDL